MLFCYDIIRTALHTCMCAQHVRHHILPLKQIVTGLAPSCAGSLRCDAEHTIDTSAATTWPQTLPSPLKWERIVKKEDVWEPGGRSQSKAWRRAIPAQSRVSLSCQTSAVEQVFSPAVPPHPQRIRIQSCKRTAALHHPTVISVLDNKVGRRKQTTHHSARE